MGAYEAACSEKQETARDVRSRRLRIPAPGELGRALLFPAPRGRCEETSASRQRRPLGLFEKSIDFDFAARAKVDAAMDDDWDYETRGQCSTVAPGILL